MQLDQILSIQDEGERKARLRDYELEKSSCMRDSGPKCAHCGRQGTRECFNPEKGKRAWQWGTAS